MERVTQTPMMLDPPGDLHLDDSHFWQPGEREAIRADLPMVLDYWHQMQAQKRARELAEVTWIVTPTGEAWAG